LEGKSRAERGDVRTVAMTAAMFIGTDGAPRAARPEIKLEATTVEEYRRFDEVAVMPEAPIVSTP